MLSLQPEMDIFLVEVAVAGVRDMQPREIFGVPIDIALPYVEFEYGDKHAEERVWRTKVVSAANDSSSLAKGPNANFLETMYIRVTLPFHHPPSTSALRLTLSLALSL